MASWRVPGPTFRGLENEVDFCIDFGGQKGPKRAHFGGLLAIIFEVHFCIDL